MVKVSKQTEKFKKDFLDHTFYRNIEGRLCMDGVVLDDYSDYKANGIDENTFYNLVYKMSVGKQPRIEAVKEEVWDEENEIFEEEEPKVSTKKLVDVVEEAPKKKSTKKTGIKEI